MKQGFERSRDRWFLDREGDELSCCRSGVSSGQRHNQEEHTERDVSTSMMIIPRSGSSLESSRMKGR